jgi:hypothetical protein
MSNNAEDIKKSHEAKIGPYGPPPTKSSQAEQKSLTAAHPPLELLSIPLLEW